jgi:hypothetical protein
MRFTNRGVELLAAVLTLVLSVASRVDAAADPLTMARQLYNEGQYDRAIAAAEEVTVPALLPAAKLVAGRARLERYRKERLDADLVDGRAALVSIDPSALTARERLELVIGFAQSLFLEGSFGASAELFASLLDQPAAWQAAGAGGRERLLEWWAGAVDRGAQQARGLVRDDLFARMRDRMTRELERDPASPVASYWIVVAWRGIGDVDRAWDTAVAGWLRARLAGPRARELSNDLDRLVRESIIPARARRRAENARDVPQLEERMQAEWTGIKARWPLIAPRADNRQ